MKGKIYLLISATLMTLISSPGFASEDLVICGMDDASSLPARLADCKAKNPEGRLQCIRNEEVMDECGLNVDISENSFIWALVAKSEEFELWLDTETGFIWSTSLTVEASPALANLVCSGTMEFLAPSPLDRLVLPELKDFVDAKSHGLYFVAQGGEELPDWGRTISGRWSYDPISGTKADHEGNANVRCILRLTHREIKNQQKKSLEISGHHPSLWFARDWVK